MTNAYYTFLPSRAGIAVNGPDGFGFLQGLLTQDMRLPDRQNLVYSAMLTPQGKIDYDFFVLKHKDGYIIECEKERAEALLQRLSMFRLRKNVTLNIIGLQVVAIYGDANALKAFSYDADPRDARLGYRKILIEPTEIKEIIGAAEQEIEFYNKLCIDHAVPNGRADMAIGEDTVAELRLDTLNGVSYSKGCYMGQELTSRMHHRGLAKKGLYKVAFTGAPLPPFTDIVVDDNLIGEMRSSLHMPEGACDGGVGLAMLRHDSLHLAAKAGLIADTAHAGGPPAPA